jgi:hypothetical protein
MFTEARTGSEDRSGSPPADDRRLGPVIARSLELGRGPPGLVNWLARHRAGPSPQPLAQLAAELNRRVRRAGITETLPE